ncbi:class I SAM-dependent methyltransferase [Nonomuraea basaltis]|uniref:class I SAM-dependent methyltransferase n=1 Tax=Nonomuraea basaltis TaxID=2495887 RepID=UPI00110C4AC4|nr:class I SAM-dependent methyltransferase [Nonomuraea basaltis]TMR88408.1 class I SAM-dependent methyltransferase [Nonomuraea basaltis]
MTATPHGSQEGLYSGPLPWDIGRPQPAFLDLAQTGAIQGRVLDVGCGTGEHTLMCAALGLEVTGVDLASRAISTAQAKARERGLTARFLRHDALRLAELGESFDTVLDSLLFHIFSDADRASYVDSLRAATKPGARLFLLCFSDRQPGAGEYGPRRVTREEIGAAFANGWTLDSITTATIDNTVIPDGVLAWLAALTRI